MLGPNHSAKFWITFTAGSQVQRERELQELVFAEEKLLESVFPRVSHLWSANSETISADCTVGYAPLVCPQNDSQTARA